MIVQIPHLSRPVAQLSFNGLGFWTSMTGTAAPAAGPAGTTLASQTWEKYNPAGWVLNKTSPDSQDWGKLHPDGETWSTA